MALSHALFAAFVLLVHYCVCSPHWSLVPGGEGLGLSYSPDTREPRTVPSTQQALSMYLQERKPGAGQPGEVRKVS